MTEPSSNTLDIDESKCTRLLDWCAAIFLSFFPAIALLTYDWHAMESLQSPAAPSTNWIGATGDYFAYYGYLLLGFAVWLIPITSFISIFQMPFARKRIPRIRNIIFVSLFIISVASIFQLSQNHLHGISVPLERINISDAGGAIGYLIMTKALSPILGEFGAGIIMILLLIISFISLVGLSQIISTLKKLTNWVMNTNQTETNQAQDNDVHKEQAKDDDSIWFTPEAKPIAPNSNSTEKEASPNPSLIDKIMAIKAAAKKAHEDETKVKSPIHTPIKETPKQVFTPPTPIYKAPPKPSPAPTKVSPVVSKPSPTAENNSTKPQEPYKLPPLSLLNPLKSIKADHGDIEETAKRLINTLSLFGVSAKITDIKAGPVVTKYAIFPEPGTRYEAITSLHNNLKGAMQAISLRIEAPIPGKDWIGFEVPNCKPASISFREIIESDTWKEGQYELPLLFGKDVVGNNLVADLTKMPHLIVAGSTGTGKSVCLNSVICGLLMSKTPEELKFIMVDPKFVEFKNYERLPHLLAPVITDNKKTERALQMAVIEMDKRLKLFSRINVRNIKQFNNRKSITQTDLFGKDQELNSDIPKKLPYIVIIIDELADLMASSAKAVTPLIAKLAAKARAAGIHLILATQRPDTKVINGTIKSNIEGRVAFKTSSSIDSRTILDHTGAENLIGRGDMLFRQGQTLVRAQGALIEDEEIENIIGYIQEHSTMQLDEVFTSRLARVKEENLEDQFKDEEDDSPRETPATARQAVRAAEKASNYKKALEIIINDHRISISYLQTRLGIGYPNASSIIYNLEKNGVIGPQKAGGSREILLSDDELMRLFNDTSDDTTESSLDENIEQEDTQLHDTEEVL